MQVKFKVLAAAALLAAGAAQAITVLPATQNSELVFTALDTGADTPTSLFIDLGILLNDSLPSNAAFDMPVRETVYNFKTNTVTVNGQVQALTGSWSQAFNDFMSVASGDRLQWAVFGADTTAGLRFVTTGNPADQAAIDGQTLAKSSVISGLNAWYTANNQLGNHASVTNGASTAVSGPAYNPNQVPTAAINWSPYFADGASAELLYVNVAPRPAPNNSRAQVTTYGGNTDIFNAPASGPDITKVIFDSAAGTLTITAVPEAETYAMLAAGLGVLALVARRRKA